MRTFRLQSLLLLVTLVAICLGVNHWVPPLGYVLLGIAAPASLRTHFVLGKRLQHGEASSALDCVEVFAMSGLIVAGLGVGSLLAFFGAAILGTIVGSAVIPSPATAMQFGLLVGMAAVVLLWWQFGRFAWREH